MSIEFKDIARNIIKSELKRKDKKVKDMVQLLKPFGENLSETSFNNKMTRGTFSAEFFLKCLKALEVKKIYLDD